MAYQLHEILLYWNLLPSAHFGLVETSTDIYHLQMNVQLLPLLTLTNASK